MKAVSDKFQPFARWGEIDNVTREIEVYELDGFVSEPALDYLQQLPASTQYASQFIEPGTKARFSQNLGDVHSLTSLMSAQQSKPTYITGGNSRLVG